MEEENEENESSYKCENCNKVLSGKGGLKYHQDEGVCFKPKSEINYNKDGKLECPKCKKTFISIPGYKGHINNNGCNRSKSKSINVSSSEIENFECKFCNKKFSNIKSYSYHIHNNNGICKEKESNFPLNFTVEPIIILQNNSYNNNNNNNLIEFIYNNKDYKVKKYESINISERNDFVFYNGYCCYTSDILYTNSSIDYLITTPCSKDWSFNIKNYDDDDDEKTEEEEVNDELKDIEILLEKENSIECNKTIVDIWEISNDNNENINPNHLISIEIDCKYIVEIKWFESEDYNDRIGIFYYLTNDNCIGIISVPAIKSERFALHKIIKIKPNIIFPLLHSTTCFCICPYDPTLFACGQNNSDVSIYKYIDNNIVLIYIYIYYFII